MNKDITQLAIEAVRKDKDSCDHIGFYVGHGFELINTQDGGLFGISALNCMLCGAVFYPKVTLLQPKANSAISETISKIESPIKP